VLNFLKYRIERFTLRLRDGLYLFLLMLALKVCVLAARVKCITQNSRQHLRVLLLALALKVMLSCSRH
jgi:hypothetical protein